MPVLIPNMENKKRKNSAFGRIRKTSLIELNKNLNIYLTKSFNSLPKRAQS